jgi:hypothetical protein
MCLRQLFRETFKAFDDALVQGLRIMVEHFQHEYKDVLLEDIQRTRLQYLIAKRPIDQLEEFISHLNVLIAGDAGDRRGEMATEIPLLGPGPKEGAHRKRRPCLTLETPGCPHLRMRQVWSAGNIGTRSDFSGAHSGALLLDRSQRYCV